MLRHLIRIVMAGLLLILSGQAMAQTLQGVALVEALQSGGYVIVMRHASSPRELPDAASVNADNVNGERQLDEQGRADAIALGEALVELDIPVSEVASSPTYRAMETARLAGFDDVAEQEELGNEGMRESGEEYTAWLQAQVADAPADSNRLLITHAPNVNAAFPDHADGMEEGEALIFDPAVQAPVARIRIAQWSSL